MACACDIHPCAIHAIAPGLPRLPRAPGDFRHWRREALAAVARQGALDGWRAREADDLGMMLVEMFAYMADVTSFYDALVAGETYLGTAQLPDAARQLLALLGYLPRPALGASVWLVAEADGTRLVRLPAGTTFRSDAFDGHPPQLFETGAETLLEPRRNSLPVARVAATALPSPLSELDLVAATLRARPGQVLVVDMGSALAAVKAGSSRRLASPLRQPIIHLAFVGSVTPPAGATYAGTQLLVAGGRAGAWKLAAVTGDPLVIDGNQLSLDGRLPIAAGDIIVLEAAGVLAARRVTAVGEASHTLLGGINSTITDADGNVTTLAAPALRTSVTRLTLDQPVPFALSATGTLIVHHGFAPAGQIHAPLKDDLAGGDPVRIERPFDPPRVATAMLALEDRHGDAVIREGALDAAGQLALVDATPAWSRDLAQPVRLAGNLVLATRGEQVIDEPLGRGDASLDRQQFRLKKKPLTYLPAANARGMASTLVLRVDGVSWREVESFHGQPADAPVYVVRHTGDGDTDIILGGALRAPTGTQITASYRFGAGAAVPPAGSVKQVARPALGLRSVRNPLPAFGGADAETDAESVVRGPASALLLGRAISLADFETAAAQRSGVRAARAAWRWDASGQRPAVIVHFIGDPQMAPGIRAALRALAEDDAPISVLTAPPQAARLDVDIETDAAYVADAVADAVGQALFAPVVPPGRGGLLRGERLGPDGVLFASHVVAAIMAVPGVAGLRGMTLDLTPFTQTGRAPSPGAWFDFAGAVRVNGRLAG